MLPVTPQMTVTAERGTDPRMTFLTASEVMARYRWARTKGYQMLKSPGFPPALNGAYRLDTLLAWEDRQLAALGWTDTAVDEAPAPAPVELPAKRRPGRPRKVAA